jgi:hypothetical protein
MIGRDVLDRISVVRGVSPITGTDDTPFVSQIIDMSNYMGFMFAILLGTLADAGFTTTILLEEGDDSALSDAAAVADADMLSMTAGTAPETAAAFTQASDDLVKTIGYVGTKRYIRLTITPSGNGSSLPIAVAGIGIPRTSGNVTGS